MSSLASVAMVCGAGMNSLFDYNRSNYMFDVPLMQSKAFQIQNLNMNRFGIFREDIRDLAAQTIDKMQSYLIVNTLKLGFIMTIYFNFDRADEELDGKSFAEVEVDLLVSCFFCCAAFWLFTSIWFSMHAVIVAQSLTTKFLCQVARAPAADTRDVRHWAPTSQHFENNLQAAFRLPFFGRERCACPPHGSLDPESVDCRSGTGSRTTGSTGIDAAGRPGRLTRSGSWRSAGSGASAASSSPLEHEGDPERGVASWQVRLGRAGETSCGLDLSRILSGEEACAADPSTEEPHLKFINLLRCQWSPYDLYSKISMVLGTVNLLRGVAFYAIYYYRTNECGFCVTPGGWITFMTFSLLAWWCVLFELSLSVSGHVFVAITMLGSCLSIIMLDGIMDPLWRTSDDDDAYWVFPLVACLTAMWETALGFSGVQWGGRWPSVWRSSAFLNILHVEAGPPNDIATAGGHCEMGAVADRGGEESFCSLGESSARGKAGPLLSCLDAVLASVPLPRAERTATLLARDLLHEMCRATGVHCSSSAPVEGFWLLVPARKSTKSHWVSTGAKEASGPPESCSRVPLGELLRAARDVTNDLRVDAMTWKAADAEKLAECGGHLVPDLRSFMSQFAQAGTGDVNLGFKASAMYFGGAVVTSILWAIILCYSVWRSQAPRASLPELETP